MKLWWWPEPGFPQCVLSTAGPMSPQRAYHNESPHCAYLCGSATSPSQRSPPPSSIIHVIDSRVDSHQLLCCMPGLACDRKHPEIKTPHGGFPPWRRCSQSLDVATSVSSNFFLNEECDPDISVSLAVCPGSLCCRVLFQD